MTKQEFFEFLNAWKAVYYQWQYSDDAFDVLYEDFEEFEKPVMMEAFKEVRRSFDRMPSMPEFRQVCLSHVKNGKRSLKKDIESKFQTVPYLREYIVMEFDKWLATKSAEERDAIESRVVNVNPLLLTHFKDWRRGDVFVVEAATILKEEEQSGRWAFDNAAFYRYQERRKQENAERMAQTKGKLLYFPAAMLTQQQEEQEKKQRRDPEWRQKKVEMNEREQLQTLIHQRDVLKSGGLAS